MSPYHNFTMGPHCETELRASLGPLDTDAMFASALESDWRPVADEGDIFSDFLSRTTPPAKLEPGCAREMNAQISRRIYVCICTYIYIYYIFPQRSGEARPVAATMGGRHRPL